jgi:SNF family Na+-dependent transporter
MAVNEGTSLLAGLVIFSVLGFTAQSTGKDISEFAASGPGLVFIAVPNAIAELPFSNLWNIAFYVMILFVGLDSQV